MGEAEREGPRGGDRPAGHRSGEVALVGLANVGKSTLLNRLVGEKLAIVTPKPQTTRSRLLGVLTRPDAQVLLVDTPGLHEGSGALHESMHRAVFAALDSADLVLLLIDRTRGLDAALEPVIERLAAQQRPFVLVGTKSDLAAASRQPWPPDVPAAAAAFGISARTGAGVADLLEDIVSRLPEGPLYVPAEDLTDRPLRFLVAELVREAAFLRLRHELPYALAVEVTAFDESRADLVRIDANLLVERASQKGIVIGDAGAMIREIGTLARPQIEALVGKRVHLALWVKVEPRWSKERRRVESLGYQ